MCAEVFGLPPSFVARISTKHDFLELRAYYALKDDYKGKPPPHDALMREEWADNEIARLTAEAEAAKNGKQ